MQERAQPGLTPGHAEFVAVARRAFEIPWINESLDQMTKARADLVAALDWLEARGARFPLPMLQLPPPYFRLAYHGLDDREINERIALFYQRTVPDLAVVAEHCAHPQGSRPRERIRLGVCSMLLRYHTIGHFVRGLIERFPRPEFEVFAIRPNIPPDPFADEIARTCDQLVTISHAFRQARRTIADLKLDVLFYPDIGMDPLTYLLAHSRLAPVQCVSWGHPDTTGLSTLDYFLSARDLEPPDGAEDHYTETLIRLDNLPTYYYRPAAPAASTPSDFALPEGRNLYLAPHTRQKFHPDFDHVIGEILRRDGSGTVVLVESSKAAHGKGELLARLGSVVPDVLDRIVVLPRVDNRRFLQFLSLADVVLDPLHFGCGRVAYEAAAIGVPIVTWPGPFMRARVVSALYARMGVSECIVRDRASYAQTAVELATDRGRRRAVVERIRQGAGAVFEQEEAVMEMAQFFGKALRAAARGRKIGDWSFDRAG